MKFEQAQISRKLTQATASHRKLTCEQTRRLQAQAKTCDELRYSLIRA